MCDTLKKSIDASTCLKIMQTMVKFHEHSPLSRKIYDVADTFWLENPLRQDQSYLVEYLDEDEDKGIFST